MHVSRRRALIGYVVQLINRSLLSFDAQTKKRSQWFWDPNHQTIAAGFEAQTGKSEPPILRINQKKQSQWFWGQTTDKPSTLVLRLNQETGASRLRVHGADHTRCHPTSRSSGHRVPDLCYHPRSSVLGLLLLPRSSSLSTMPHLPPAHHETSKRDSSNETKIKIKLPKSLKFEFKPRQFNDSSQSNQGTDHLVSQNKLSTFEIP
jgi:hypothetical protein